MKTWKKKTKMIKIALKHEEINNYERIKNEIMKRRMNENEWEIKRRMKRKKNYYYCSVTKHEKITKIIKSYMFVRKYNNLPLYSAK